MVEDAIEDLICLAIEFKPNMNPVPGPALEPQVVDLRDEVKPVVEKTRKKSRKKVIKEESLDESASKGVCLHCCAFL